MSEGIIEAIREFAQEKGIDDDFVLHIVEQALKASYKKQFGTDANAVFNEETGKIYSKKIITEDAKNPVFDISLEEAKKLAPSCEAGDELLVEVDPKSLGINSVKVGMQRAIQCIREMQKDTLYAEYSTKVGEIIIGYYHRERNGNIYVDLGKGSLWTKCCSRRRIKNKSPCTGSKKTPPIKRSTADPFKNRCGICKADTGSGSARN